MCATNVEEYALTIAYDGDMGGTDAATRGVGMYGDVAFCRAGGSVG